MPSAAARIAIATPPRYLIRLAKHFEHRVAVQRNERSANVAFPQAPCALLADDTHLHIRIDAVDNDTLARLQEVVTRHLKQVASQETFDIEWLVG